MMKKQILITTLLISRTGERRHFQIKLPMNTRFVTGVHYGVRIIHNSDSMLAKLPPSEVITTQPERSPVMGTLKLQSCEESNWFYATDVVSADVNLKYGDYSDAGLKASDFTHGSKRSKELVKVNADSTILKGWYMDEFGITQKMGIYYEVKIYVVINVEE